MSPARATARRRCGQRGADSEVGAQGAADEMELMRVLREALPEDTIVFPT